MYSRYIASYCICLQVNHKWSNNNCMSHVDLQGPHTKTVWVARVCLQHCTRAACSISYMQVAFDLSDVVAMGCIMLLCSTLQVMCTYVIKIASGLEFFVVASTYVSSQLLFLYCFVHIKYLHTSFIVMILPMYLGKKISQLWMLHFFKYGFLHAQIRI